MMAEGGIPVDISRNRDSSKERYKRLDISDKTQERDKVLQDHIQTVHEVYQTIDSEANEAKVSIKNYRKEYNFLWELGNCN